MSVCLTLSYEFRIIAMTSEPFTSSHSAPYARGFLHGYPQRVSKQQLSKPLAAAVGSAGRFLLESVKRCCVMTQQRSYHTQCGINCLSEWVPCPWRRLKLIVHSAHFHTTTGLEGNIGTSGKLGRARPRGGDHRPMRFPGYIILWPKYKGDMDAK
jgi:hypothetical protein